MKAIVAEIDKKQMIVITENGDFLKVKRQMSATIGDEIQLKQQKKYLSYKRLAGIAACFLACIFLSTGVYAYYTPYSYVSVDINPSVSLSLNRFERVISVNPLTEDAVSFIKDTKNLKNQDIDNALSEIIRSASDKGYINNDEEEQIIVVVSAKSPEQEKKLKDTLAKTADKELSKADKSFDITVEKTSVESYKASLTNKVSPGKEILVDKLREINPEIKDEEVKDMSVNEVAKLIKERRKAAKEEEKNNKKREKEERIQNSKDEDEKHNKGTGKAAGEGKGNSNNDKNTNPETAASKDADDKKDEVKERIEAGKEEKERAREGEKAEAERNKKKDEENKDEDKNNEKEIKDRDKKNNNPEEKDNDNKSDNRNKGRNRAK